MKKMSKEQASDLIETLCGSNGFYISTCAQKVMDASPNISTIPADRRYVILSITHDLDETIIYGYDSLRQKVIDSGHIPIDSHHELSAYVLEYWDELRSTGFSFLSSSAPAVQVDDERAFVDADLVYKVISGNCIDAKFCLSTAILAYTKT